MFGGMRVLCLVARGCYVWWHEGVMFGGMRVLCLVA